jgi:O-antigen biosynthesis protein WbqV
VTRNGSSRFWAGRYQPLDTPLRKEFRSAEITDEPHPEALLGRFVDRLRAEEFAQHLEGATVLITGAAGFLGSRLAERVARSEPKRVVLVDSAEGPLVDLVTRGRSEWSSTDTVPVLADIRSPARASDVVARYRPHIVFHAAAYKHVPLVEANPIEGVATNVLGTRNMVEASRKIGVERFVFFSSDKAVRPRNVLGQTKAAAEWLVAAAGDQLPGSRYSSIRLANVLDATGGILRCFRRQIQHGGPLTVTDPRATRLLMTSGEAVALALVCAAIGDSSSAFWLDVGPPVRIVDFASKLAAGREIDIEFIGLRQGENLEEESFSDGNQTSVTPCEGVFKTALPRVDSVWLDAWTAELTELVERASDEEVRSALDAVYAVAEREPAALAGAVG